MLISGGLIILGLLAVVGAFFLARTGESASVAHNVVTSQETETIHNHTLTAPQQDNVPTTIVREERDVTLLNGQLDEITEQLQSLQQRLFQLNNSVEHEENGDVSTSFDQAAVPDTLQRNF